MSLADIGPGVVVPGWVEPPWWLGPQLRLVVGDRPEPAGVGGDGQGPAEVVDCYARQLDELAAVVEAALREEADDHRALVELVRVRHQRRVTTLRVLAESLGEAHGQLDELAHRLRAATPEAADTPEPGTSAAGTSVPVGGGL